MLVEPDISPLAKRLAEENNVNWRGLLGSGAGGKIVERDVLEYLAKVMAGEEDINPTAEPLPEGMDAWPEDDVRSFYGGAMPETASETAQATADDELFMDTSPLEASVASVSHQPIDDGAAIGEDIFLIDDDVPAHHADLDVSALSSEPTFAEPAFAEPVFADEVDPFTEVAAETLGTDGSVNDDFMVDDIATFDDGDSEVFAAMTEGDAFVADSDVEDLASLFVDGSDSVEDTYAAVSEAAVVDHTVAFEAPAEPEFAIPSYGDVAPDDVVEALAAENVDDVIASFEDEPVFETASSLEATTEAETAGFDSGFESHTPVSEEAAFDAPAVHAEPAYAEPVTYAHETPMQPAPVFAEVAPVVAAVAGTGLAASFVESSAPVVPNTLPLVSYGVLLRRHVDLSVLMHAQQAIAEETGQEEAGSVTGLLLRAAAKAQQKVALVAGNSVGLAVIHNNGVSVAHVQDAASAPFRTVLDHTRQVLSGHQADKVDLAVADMSGFDIDEAVLNIGVPVLTLGRTMYDSSKGTHHSTLSLSGNVSIESGTKFLSAVAELLNSPVRLVI
jgi:hypothetical protein